MDYNAPNFYCTNGGDWPPGYTCSTSPEGTTDRIGLFDGAGNTLNRAYIYFENGSWDTGWDIPGGCGGSGDFQASIKYASNIGLFTVFSGVQTLHASPCVDRHKCPIGTSVSDPINVGSGDVMVRQPLFMISQEPTSLPFTMTYHSSAAQFPTLVDSTYGLGWTHEYAQTLRPEPGTNGDRLYHITAEGYEHEYLRIAPSTKWIAVVPGELRGTVAQVGSEYQLTDLNGMVTSFDITTGHWSSTKDRWGNTISGTYTSGLLTTITDSMGRQITLAYPAGQVTITLPNAKVWKLTLTGNLLTSIFDPLHTAATAWRTYAYVNDHAGVQRLLTSILDDASKEIEAHTYDNTAGTGTDRALTGSQAGGTKSNISIAYDDVGKTRTVVHTINSTTSQTAVFNVAYLAGRWMTTQISGNCATCGGSDTDLQIFTYDYGNHVIDRKDGSGADQVETQFTYDGNGMMLSKTEALGRPEARTTTFTYAIGTPANFLSPWPAFMTSMTEASAAKSGQSKTTTFTWSNTGTCAGAAAERCLVTQTSGFLSSTDPSATVYTMTSNFDSNHRLTSVLGPANNQQTAFVFNTNAATNNGGRRNLTKVFTSATAHLDTSLASYDLYGTAGTVTDPNAVQTTYTTDARGRVTKVISKKPASDPNEPADYTTTYTYDKRERLTSVLLPAGNKISYTYEDGTNRLLNTIQVDAGGLQQARLHLTLNTIGDKTKEDAQVCTVPATSCVAANWVTKRTESFKYDTHNRLSEIDHPTPSGSKIVYTYDTRGNLRTVQDENHSAANTTYAYDGLNRLVSVIQTLTGATGTAGSCPAAAGTIATCYGYDVQDNLNSVFDPNTNNTTYAYDDFKRVQKQTSPVSGVTTYTYDPAGNVLAAQDANAATTTRVYDAANRVTSATSVRSGLTTEAVTYTYDSATSTDYGKGRLATMTDPVGSSAYAYERRGLLRSDSKTISATAFPTTYAYDPNGNRKTVTYPSLRSVAYTFDYADRPITATRGATTYVSSATYAPFGPETTIVYGNGTTKTVTLDQRYRVTENKLTSGAGTIADYTYLEDTLGNITQLNDAVTAAFNRTFAYDDLNRLTTANSGTSLWGTATGNGYAYDKMGNVTTVTLGASRTASFLYSGTLPKLTSVTESGLGMRSVFYDAAGNETAVGAGTMTYSTRNFLKTADSLTYGYDGRGLRTTVTQGTNKRYFFYSPEMSLLEETSLAATPTAAGGYDQIWFNGHPVAEEDGGTHWTFTDHLGTPFIQTDAAAAVFWRAEYEPYGRVFSLRTVNQHAPLRLPGQEAEELNLSTDGNGATERFYNIFRWYRPRWGRYTQNDPIRTFGDAVNIGSLRLASFPEYGYAGDRPTLVTDRFGLCSNCDACPGGTWTYNAFPSFSFALVFGISRSYGTYTCESNPRNKVPVKTTCFIAGPIIAAGFGADTNPFGGGCGCNPQDLTGYAEGSYATAGPFSLTQIVSPFCSRVLRTVGIAKSVGAGGAYVECRTEITAPVNVFPNR